MKNDKILVTGSTGFLGTNLVKHMESSGYKNIVAVSSKDYDLTEQKEVRKMFSDIEPNIVIHLAAYVGGILANKMYPADFSYRNLVINTSTIHEASKHGVKKFVTCIGGCSYPAKAKSPIAENSLFEGYPQNESAPYSLAKAMGFVQANAYRNQYNLNAITLVPGNMYGPHDNFHPNYSHVIPGLIRRFYEAKMNDLPEVVVWGSGTPTRDFVYVEDVAEAIIKATETYDGNELINISSGTETSIRELVETISNLIGYGGKIVWDTTKPDGQMRKIFDTGRMKSLLNFECSTFLKDGLEKTIRWFENNYPNGIRL
ncbi:MAG: GDP-L-fucose synthase [Candidatus Aenigmarchaeota archaeon]|nr:GDP-L-fucose synthase [Candidatus Aenigmarchaeota archaeon]